MTVHTISLVSRTVVDFQGEGGQSVKIINETAYYTFHPSGAVQPVVYIVCAADGTLRARLDLRFEV